MTLCPMPLDSVVLDSCSAKLKAYATAQNAIQAGAGFDVARNQLRPHSLTKGALVNLWSGSQPKGEIQRTGGIERATINADLFTRMVDRSVGGVVTHGDQAAFDRLLWLREQVKRCLWDLINFDFGLPPGAISERPVPVWELFLTEHGFPDDTIVAGRWSFEVPYSWTPDDSAPVVEFETVSVTELSGAFAVIV